MNVVYFYCHVVLETMSVELHGRSHPAHNAARMVHYTEHTPCGCQGMKVKGSLKGAWSQQSRCQRLLYFSKSWGLRVRGIQGQW